MCRALSYKIDGKSELLYINIIVCDLLLSNIMSFSSLFRLPSRALFSLFLYGCVRMDNKNDAFPIFYRDVLGRGRGGGTIFRPSDQHYSVKCTKECLMEFLNPIVEHFGKHISVSSSSIHHFP